MVSKIRRRVTGFNKGKCKNVSPGEIDKKCAYIFAGNGTWCC